MPVMLMYTTAPPRTRSSLGVDALSRCSAAAISTPVAIRLLSIVNS